MRQTLSRGMVAAAAATGILSLCGSPVFADSNADGSAAGSPGVASGNTIQAPVHVPVNVCGNTVNVIAALNPAFGNSCANGPRTQAAAPVAPAAVPEQTPGGNGSTPAHNPSTPSSTPSSTPNNNGPGVPHQTPTTTQGTPTGPGQTGKPGIPPQQSASPQISAPLAPSHPAPALAETGSEGVLAASAVSVAMLAGGLVLYRRGRATSHR